MNNLDYQVENFSEFCKKNWSELIEIAEDSTGESYDGLEPLLNDDGVKEVALDIWEDYRK